MPPWRGAPTSACGSACSRVAPGSPQGGLWRLECWARATGRRLHQSEARLSRQLLCAWSACAHHAKPAVSSHSRCNPRHGNKEQLTIQWRLLCRASLVWVGGAWTWSAAREGFNEMLCNVENSPSTCCMASSSRRNSVLLPMALARFAMAFTKGRSPTSVACIAMILFVLVALVFRCVGCYGYAALCCTTGKLCCVVVWVCLSSMLAVTKGEFCLECEHCSVCCTIEWFVLMHQKQESYFCLDKRTFHTRTQRRFGLCCRGTQCWKCNLCCTTIGYG